MKNKIIIALDTDDLSKAKKMVKTLLSRVNFFKIGLEMINTGQAPELIEYINKLGGKVFYDIKLNDIPNTVGRATKVISKLGVWGFTIHASAGKESIMAAIRNKGRSKIVGVTLLTSLTSSNTKREVLRLAKILKQAGAYGIVCSSNEAEVLKKLGLKIITPGIRPVWANKNDQKRIAAPKEAIEKGADYLIIGRPVTYPPKTIATTSLEALNLIIEEIKTREQ